MSTSAYADGFGFNLGPFNMQINGPSDNYIIEYRSDLDSPVCYAISNLTRLEITVEGVENVSTKEKKIVIKRLTVEPYAFGVTREGRPVLRGNVIDEKLVKEITLKYGEEHFDETTVSSDTTKKGYFTGMFSSEKNKNIDIRRISDIHVIEGSHFVAPNDYKGINDDSIQVICQLPVHQ